MRSLALALTVCLLAPAAAHAQTRRGPWGRYLDPDQRQGERYLRDGLRRLVRALGPQDPAMGDPARYVLVEQALLRFERARATLGEDPELAYYTAYALSNWERPATDGGTEYRTDDALEAWRRVREIAPDYHPARVASELAVLHMRRQRFGVARAEYERALERAVPRTVELAHRFYLPAQTERALASLHGPVDRATLHSNLAEVTMLTGDVDAAIVSYRASIDIAEFPVTRSLAQWGLALALDRSGDHEGALRQATRAIREDPIPPTHPSFSDLHRAHGAFTVLHLDSVFFEPPYEIHAYEALGHEAASLDADEAGGAARHLASALRSWRLFLAEGGTVSRFGAAARAHADRLEALTGTGGVRAPSSDSPPSPPWGRGRRR